ncbi:MAG: hypothetical protein ABH863_04020 [Candidatus Micrarchaeota archaeon]
MAKERPDWLNHTSVLCRVDHVFDREALNYMAEHHIITPCDKVIPQDERTVKYGSEAGSLFFYVKVRNPTTFALQIEPEYHNRVAYHEPVTAGPRDRLFAFKGIGSSVTKWFAHGNELLGTHWWEDPKQQSMERKFWGAARKGTVLNSATAAMDLAKEFEKAKAEGDLAVRKAERYGVKSLNLTSPIATFIPLELPVLIVHGKTAENIIADLPKKLPETKGLPIDKTKSYPFYSRPDHDLLQIDQETILSNFGVSGHFIRDQRIYAYSLPINGADRIGQLGEEPDKVSPISTQYRQSPGINRKARVNLRENMGRFAASTALLIYIMHHRLGKAGTTNEGSMFSGQNIAIGSAQTGPVFHDYDTIHPITANDKSGIAGDLLNARHSMIAFGLEIGAPRSLIKKADRTFFSVYRTAEKGKYPRLAGEQFDQMYGKERELIETRNKLKLQSLRRLL